LIYLGEAPDIKQKATSDRLISPCGDIESIMRATKKRLPSARAGKLSIAMCTAVEFNLGNMN
jgi:hypothetical protein